MNTTKIKLFLKERTSSYLYAQFLSRVLLVGRRALVVFRAPSSFSIIGRSQGPVDPKLHFWSFPPSFFKAVAWGLLAGLMPSVCEAATWAEKTMIVTAYCPCGKCCDKYGWGYTTASGHKIKAGDKFVAAPKSIPFGTMIDIPGYGRVPVLDRGGAIKGNRLDVYFPTHKEALNWGKKTLKVRVQK